MRKAVSLWRTRVPEAVFREQELPRDHQPFGVFLEELSAELLGFDGDLGADRVGARRREAQAPRDTTRTRPGWSLVRFSSAPTSSAPLNTSESTTAMLTNTTPLKWLRNILSSSKSACRPSPPYPPTNRMATGSAGDGSRVLAPVSTHRAGDVGRGRELVVHAADGCDDAPVVILDDEADADDDAGDDQRDPAALGEFSSTVTVRIVRHRVSPVR